MQPQQQIGFFAGDAALRHQRSGVRSAADEVDGGVVRLVEALFGLAVFQPAVQFAETLLMAQDALVQPDRRGAQPGEVVGLGGEPGGQFVLETALLLTSPTRTCLL